MASAITCSQKYELTTELTDYDIKEQGRQRRSSEIFQRQENWDHILAFFWDWRFSHWDISGLAVFTLTV